MKQKMLLLGCICIGVALMCVSFYFYGYENTWKLWGIPVGKQPFYDLRLITGGAQSYKEGYDQQVFNLYDPEQRVFNYPRIWYVVLASGLNLNWTISLGILIIGLFLVGVVIFPGKLNRFSIFLLVGGLVSPAILFGIERANVDIFIFFIVALGQAFFDVSIAASFLSLFVGVLLKIFPILGIGYFLDLKRGKSLRPILLGVALTVAYFVLTLSDMIFIFRNTFKGADYSYGVEVLPFYLYRLISDRLMKSDSAVLLVVSRAENLMFRFPFLLYLLVILILVASFYFGIRARSNFQFDDLRNLRAFWSGAGIYIGTFLLGNNWDYRLAFLLFTLPQLAYWAHHKNGQSTLIARVTLGILFLSLWYMVVKEMIFVVSPVVAIIYPIVNQGINWLLFAGLSYLCAFSLPRWFFKRKGPWWQHHPWSHR